MVSHLSLEFGIFELIYGWLHCRCNFVADHPRMCVLSKVIFGELTIDSYDRLDYRYVSASRRLSRQHWPKKPMPLRLARSYDF
jgi:hypothetical protein